MNERAVLYARVSTDLQRENFSIPSQLTEALQYASLRGYTIVGDQFVDPETGMDTLKNNGAIPAYVDDYTSRELSRPSLDAAFDYLESTGFDILIVYVLDRLARDPYIRQTLEMEFEARGARVEYVLGDYDDTPQGEVRKDLDATFAKWENAIRTERFNRGKRKKAQSGLFVTGITPYGYTRDKNALGGLAIDEERAKVVRRIFEMYAQEGLSLKAIVDRLNEEGAPAYRDKWAKTTLKRLLKNTVYIGKLYYNKTRYRGKRPRESRSRDEWIEIPTTPIVDANLFEEVQNRFRRNLEFKRRQTKRFYLLSGLIVCGYCGRSYVAQTYRKGKRRKTELQTYRHRKRLGHCLNREIPAKRIEPSVWGEIVSILKDPGRLRRGYEESLEQQKVAQSRKLAHLETTGKRIVKLERSRQNLNTAYIDPEIPLSKPEYIAQKTKIDRELKSLAEEIAAIEKDLGTVPSPSELETLEAFAATINQKLDFVDPPPEEKRKILELLHVRVIIDQAGNSRLEGWFSLEEDIGLLDRQL